MKQETKNIRMQDERRVAVFGCTLYKHTLSTIYRFWIYADPYNYGNFQVIRLTKLFNYQGCKNWKNNPKMLYFPISAMNVSLICSQQISLSEKSIWNENIFFILLKSLLIILFYRWKTYICIVVYKFIKAVHNFCCF